MGTSRRSSSADSEEWLPVAKPGANGRNGHSAVNGGGNGVGRMKPGLVPEPSHSRRHRRRRRLPKRATARERWLIVRLRRSKRRVEEMRERIDQLNRRISELEAAPEPRASAESSPATPKPKRTARAAAANGSKSSSARSAKRSRTTKAATTRQKKPATNGAGAKRKGGAKLDLNKATFDQLRGLGLSVTQTSRLISYRESDGFSSVDDLKQIPGLAQGTVATLRSRVRVA